MLIQVIYMNFIKLQILKFRRLLQLVRYFINIFMRPNYFLKFGLQQKNLASLLLLCVCLQRNLFLDAEYKKLRFLYSSSFLSEFGLWIAQTCREQAHKLFFYLVPFVQTNLVILNLIFSWKYTKKVSTMCR